MGLLDSLRSAATPQFNVQRAIMTVVIAAIEADGEIANDEVKRLRAMCAISPIFAANTQSEDDEVISFAATVTSQFGESAITMAAEALGRELRETAFALASDMVLADGIAGPDEIAFLENLIQGLDLDGGVADGLVRAAVIRNRSATG